MKTIYATIRIDYEGANEEADLIAEMVCERANAHNHTIESGIRIDNVEFCDINY